MALFSAVNESTWEHIKICSTPTIFWGMYEIIKYGFDGNFIFAKSLSILTIFILITILFYSYAQFTKKTILFIDVICSQLVFENIINLNNILNIYIYLSILLLVIELVLYLCLTLKPFKN